MADTLPNNPSDNLTGDNEKDLNSLSVRVEKMPDSAEKTELQKKVRELLAEVKAQNTQEQEKKLAEKDRFRTYNDSKMSEFGTQISSVDRALDTKTDENNMKLRELLKNAQQDHSYENVSTLQGFMRKNWTDSVVSRKGDPDGFFGPLTMGSLEKIVEIKKVENNPVSAAQKEWGTESKPTIPELKPEDKIKPSHIQKQNILKQSHTQIPSVPAKSLETKKEVLLSNLDEWTAYFSKVVEGKQQHFRNKTELEKDFATIGWARDWILKYINQLTTKKDLAPEELEKINSAKILIARYFADELPSISNSHFKDYALASTQLLDVIGVFEYTNKEKQTSRRVLPQPPTRADIEKKLADTPEWVLITQHLRNRKTMDQILTNPKFKSAWFNVTEKIYGEWEDKLGKQLKWTLDGYNAGNILLNPQQLEALNLLNNIHGVEVLDIASRNKDRAKMFGTGLLAVGAGAAGAALTATGVGAVGWAPMLALASSAIVWGMITTWAGMAIDGRMYSKKEWLIEWGINTATFAVGGMLFKLWAKATMAWRVAKVGLYTAEAGWVVATGVVSDEIRGCFYGADVSLTESIKQNLVWALLPLAFRAAGKKGVFTERQTHRAEAIENNLKRAETQVNIWDKAGSKATLQGVVKDAENLADDVKQTVENGKSQGKWKTEKQPEKNEGVKNKAKIWEQTGTSINNLAANPIAANQAIENISNSSRKLGSVFSTEWIKKIANASWKSVGWVADQSVGPVVRILTGNNPSNLLSLAIPKSGYLKGAKDVGSKFANHWKHPVSNWRDLVITWEWEGGFLGKVFKNVLPVAGITAMDYYMAENKKDALNPWAIAQNYYEVLLLGWLGIALMELPWVWGTATKTWGFLSDRFDSKPIEFK